MLKTNDSMLAMSFCLNDIVLIVRDFLSTGGGGVGMISRRMLAEGWDIMVRVVMGMVRMRLLMV